MSAIEPAIFKPQNQQRRGTTTSILTIARLQGHRRSLIDFFVRAAASSSSEVRVGNVVIARIFDNLAQAVLVGNLGQRFRDWGLIAWLKQLIPEFPMPTATQDEDIIITRAAAPTRIDAYFEDTETGDVLSKAVLGGSQATKQFFILNMSNQAAIVADGQTLLGVGDFDMPPGLTVFGGGNETRIAPNQKFTIYAIAANVPVNVASTAKRIHIFDERIELFTSENNEGLLTEIGVDNELQFSLNPLRAFLLRTPYEFNANRLLTARIEVDHDGANNLAVNTQQLFLIGTREFIGGP